MTTLAILLSLVGGGLLSTPDNAPAVSNHAGLFLCLTALGLALPNSMADGSVISGELVAPNDDGAVIRRASGGLTSRMGWDKFAETRRELAKEPGSRRRWRRSSILPRVPPRWPSPRCGQGTPGKINRRPGRQTFAACRRRRAIYRADHPGRKPYAGYEVSVFRNYPAAAVVARA
jgi:hypothetical protein